MKKNNTSSLITLLAGLALLVSVSQGAAQGTAFAYQGRLTTGTNAANGIFDLLFAVYGTNSAGSPLAAGTNAGLAVSNGFFTSTLDFGGGIFTGADRWLEIAVRTNGSPGGFTTLSPRQQLLPTPYAILAGNLNGVQIQPNDSGAPNVIGGAPVNFVGPNVIGAFIGGGGATYDQNALGSYSNSVSGSYGTVSGGQQNSIGRGASGSTIAGGANNNVLAFVSTIGGGAGNQIQQGANRSTIAGGGDNLIDTGASQATIAGGAGNTVSAVLSAVGGGTGNAIQFGAYDSTIAGGFDNTISSNATLATIAGGYVNTIGTNASQATIAGGAYNTVAANGINTTIAGGTNNSAGSSSGSDTVGGGSQNRATGGYSIVAGGYANTSVGYNASVGGGTANNSSGASAAIAGGYGNTASGSASAVPGGFQNQAAGSRSLAGGESAQALHDRTFVWSDNSGLAPFASTGSNQFLILAKGGVGIGTNNPQSALHVNGTVTANSFNGSMVAPSISVGGPVFATTYNGSYFGTTSGPVELDAGGSAALRLSPNAAGAPNVIGGAAINYVSLGTVGATIGGGGSTNYYDYYDYFTYSNSISADFSTISGGRQNTVEALGTDATIAGGLANTVQIAGYAATISGGIYNQVGTSARYSVIAGGQNNAIGTNSSQSVISGGGGNLISANSPDSTISGGQANNIQAGPYSTISGGRDNAIYSDDATISGGGANYIQTNSPFSSIAAGYNNQVASFAPYATISGGNGNAVGGYGAAIPGGVQNWARGSSAFAAGNQAQATNDGAFVWADSTPAAFSSTGANQFLIRASGGVGIGTNTPQSALHVNGTVTANGFAGSGAALSGVNAAQLGGQPPAAFAPATGSSNYLSKSGGAIAGSLTVTGSLNATTFLGSGSGLTGISGGSIVPNSIPSAALAPNAVTASNVASGQLVKSLNGLHDTVTLAAGPNVSLSAVGNTLFIEATNSGGGSNSNGFTLPFIGTSSNSNPLISVYNTGSGAAMYLAANANDFLHQATLQVVGGNSNRAIYAYDSAGTSVFGETSGGKALYGWDDGGGQGLHAFSSYGTAIYAETETGLAGVFSGSVGIGVTNPSSMLQVGGTVTAASFAGSGAGLVNVPVESLTGVAANSMLFTNFILRNYTNGPEIIYAQLYFQADPCSRTFGPTYGWDNTGNCDFRLGLSDHDSAKWYITEAAGSDDFSIASVGVITAGVPDSPRILLPYANNNVVLVRDGGAVGIGTDSPAVPLDVNGETRTCKLTITGGCDLSEPFNLSPGRIPQGAVVVIDEENPGQLKLSSRAYDSRVAGIVSGANGIKPGISLQQAGVNDGGQNVALSGRVYAMADASYGEIRPGDLLTTSDTEGHCMKATDHSKAQGAVIGKAMSPLMQGKGMVLVLVSLQ